MVSNKSSCLIFKIFHLTEIDGYVDTRVTHYFLNTPIHFLIPLNLLTFYYAPLCPTKDLRSGAGPGGWVRRAISGLPSLRLVAPESEARDGTGGGAAGPGTARSGARGAESAQRQPPPVPSRPVRSHRDPAAPAAPALRRRCQPPRGRPAPGPRRPLRAARAPDRFLKRALFHFGNRNLEWFVFPRCARGVSPEGSGERWPLRLCSFWQV